MASTASRLPEDILSPRGYRCRTVRIDNAATRTAARHLGDDGLESLYDKYGEQTRTPLEHAALMTVSARTGQPDEGI